MIMSGGEGPAAKMVEEKQWMFWLKNRHYDKAPIKEAVIDIQIDGASSRSVTVFAGASLPSGYVPRQTIVKGLLRGQLTSGRLSAEGKQDEIGYVFVGGDGKHVAQFKTDGFTFSRLAPYLTWEQLRDEARTLERIYTQLVGPHRVIRIGLRYVNQIDMPNPVRDFRDFVRVYPEISSDLPQLLSGFFMQAQIPQTDIDAMLVISEAMVPPPNEAHVSLILDIDVFRQGNVAKSGDEVWEVLEVLRLRKNLVFEGCITNNTRELIS